MIEGIRVTFIGSGKHPNVVVTESGFDVIPLRRGGGVEIVGNLGQVQFLDDEVVGHSVTDTGDKAELVTAKHPIRVKSRRYRPYHTMIETRLMKPSASLTVVPKDGIDRFVYKKRAFPSIVLEALPTAAKS